MSTIESNAPSQSDVQAKQQIPEGPSILDKLRERANQQLEQQYNELEKQKEEEKRQKKKYFRNKFKLKKNSPEAERLRSLSRKEKRKLKKDQKKLLKMSEKEQIAYFMLTDPNNQFMRKLTVEGDQGFQDLQRRQMWANIKAKKQQHGSINEFMNSLTEAEFTEFIQCKEIPYEKLKETGRQKDEFGINLNELVIDNREQAFLQHSMSSQQNQEQGEIIIDDIQNEFKVFRDPTFKEFTDIVGTQYNKDLPLFAQLYIIKEMLQFYQLNQNKTFVSLSVLNIVLNIAYFYGNRKILFRKVPFFSMTRIFVIFVLSQFLHEQIVLKQVVMPRYRVNLNDLFDQDEDFLFENEHFRALIRKTQNQFEYLVNPVFDIEEIFKNAKPDVDELYKKPKDGYQQMNQADLMLLYQQTFNSPMRSRLVYDRMIEQYDKFFENEKKDAERKLNTIVAGKSIHELIKYIIKFFEQSEANKHKKLYDQLDENNKKEYNETKQQMNQFIDGLIETLNNEFGEKSVSVSSPRRDKVALLKKLSQELDSEYSDDSKFYKLIQQNQEELLQVHMKEKTQFVPKTDLKFKEYVGIKNFFSAADFERNSFLTMTFPFVSTVLWFMQRFGRKFKWL